MALPLQVTIAGTVTTDIQHVFVGDVEIALIDGRYETTVPVAQKLVTLTAIDSAGRTWTRTIQLNALASTTA